MLGFVVIACMCLSLLSIGAFRSQETGGKANGQEASSFSERLQETKYIGLEANEKIGGYTVHQYTLEQHKKKLQFYAAARTRYDVELAEDATLSAEEINGFRPPAFLRSPASPLGNVQPGEVVYFGTDYIELRLAATPQTMLIPLTRICCVKSVRGSTDLN